MAVVSHDPGGSAAKRSRPRTYEDLRRSNARHAELMRAKAMRIRLDRALQADRERRVGRQG